MHHVAISAYHINENFGTLQKSLYQEYLKEKLRFWNILNALNVKQHNAYMFFLVIWWQYLQSIFKVFLLCEKAIFNSLFSTHTIKFPLALSDKAIFYTSKLKKSKLQMFLWAVVLRTNINHNYFEFC